MEQGLKFNDEPENEPFNEESEGIASDAGKYTARLRLDMGSDHVSEMICRVLSVDKEPARSKASRCLSTENQFLVADFISTDRKYLQKSMDNFMEMCDLTVQTIEAVEKYKLGDFRNLEEKPNKKRKRAQT